MMGIFNQQIHVIEEFSRHLQNLHERETEREATGEGAKPSVLKVLMDIKKVLEDQQEAKKGETGHLNGSSVSSQSALLQASSGSMISSQSSATAVPGKTIPDHTLHLAEDVSRDIGQRREELRKLEESTVYVCDQVGLPFSSVFRSYSFLFPFSYFLKLYTNKRTAQIPPRSQATTSQHNRSQIRPQTRR
jgi:hypothetical protein